MTTTISNYTVKYDISQVDLNLKTDNVPDAHIADNLFNQFQDKIYKRPHMVMQERKATFIEPKRDRNGGKSLFGSKTDFNSRLNSSRKYETDERSNPDYERPSNNSSVMYAFK